MRNLRNNKYKFVSQNAFTLVEMIVVLVIISLLMGFLLKGIWGQADSAKVKLTEMKMQKLKSSINQYQLVNNKLPQNLEMLASCQGVSGPCVPVAQEEDLSDAWGTPFSFQLDGSGRSYKIKSFGSDKRDGGSDASADFSIEGP